MDNVLRRKPFGRIVSTLLMLAVAFSMLLPANLMNVQAAPEPITIGINTVTYTNNGASTRPNIAVTFTSSQSLGNGCGYTLGMRVGGQHLTHAWTGQNGWTDFTENGNESYTLSLRANLPEGNPTAGSTVTIGIEAEGFGLLDSVNIVIPAEGQSTSSPYPDGALSR